MFNFIQMVAFALHNKQFYDLANLMNIGETFLVFSADCIRGFHVMNAIKEKLGTTLKNAIWINYKLYGYSNNLNSVYIKGLNAKDRIE